jgi:HB1, ASXL, restriction endonuclease HTH domain
LSKSEKSRPELPGFHGALEVTHPALTGSAMSALPLIGNPRIGRHVMAASRSSKKTKSKKTKETAAEVKKLSALDAAAKVLAEAGQPMSCKDLIEAMAQKGYWSSPGGKTPASTLYSGITKEISTKGKESRFQKTDRGHFART